VRQYLQAPELFQFEIKIQSVYGTELCSEEEKKIYIYFDSSPLKMPSSVHILNFEYRTSIGFSVFCFMPLFYIVWHNQLAMDVTKYMYKFKGLNYSNGFNSWIHMKIPKKAQRA